MKEFKSFCSIGEGKLTGSGAVKNGFYGGASYVYRCNDLMKEERAKTEQRAALARAFSAPARCERYPQSALVLRPVKAMSGNAAALRAILGGE
jgi:hypothetical protein